MRPPPASVWREYKAPNATGTLEARNWRLEFGRAFAEEFGFQNQGSQPNAIFYNDATGRRTRVDLREAWHRWLTDSRADRGTQDAWHAMDSLKQD